MRSKKEYMALVWLIVSLIAIVIAIVGIMLI